MGTFGRTALVAATTAALVANGSAATAGGGFVVNDNGSALMVDASYYRDGVSGYVSAWQQQNGDGVAFLYEQSGDWVQCSGAGTKKTTDDVYGFVGTFTYGEGTASVTVGSRYSSGSAAAVVQAHREVVDECAGTYVVTELGDVPIAVDLTTSGAVTTTRDRGAYHVPSGFNERYAFSFTGRWGTGSVEVGGVTSPAEGFVGKSSWSYHGNG